MLKNAVAKFKEKLEAVAKDTGLDYEILVEDFNQHIENNHLFAGWFMPGTVLAKATDGETTIIYEVDGEVDAQLVSPSGEPVCSFGQTFSMFENDDILIIDDYGLEALIKGSASGYTIAFISNSRVKVYIEGSSIDPVISKDLSVAKSILNKDIALELLKAAKSEVKPKDRLPDGKINRRLDALEEAAMQLGFDDMPDPPSEPDDEPSAIESDIPHFFDTEEGKKALEEAGIIDPEDEEDEDAEEPEEEKPKKKTSAKKSPKKDAKSPTPKEKKTDKAPIKKEKDDEEDNYRFDLLPLDLIGEFIDAFEDAEEANFLTSIEEYKRGDKRLIDAALSFAKANYTDAVDAVMGLAEIAAVGKDVAENEETKTPDATGYINDAVMNYLLSLRDNVDRKDAILHNLVCAAWSEKETA